MAEPAIKIDTELTVIKGRKRNYRRLLYIIYIPLLLIEWAVDLVLQLWSTFHKSIESLTLATLNILNEPDKSKPSD